MVNLGCTEKEEEEEKVLTRVDHSDTLVALTGGGESYFFYFLTEYSRTRLPADCLRAYRWKG